MHKKESLEEIKDLLSHSVGVTDTTHDNELDLLEKIENEELKVMKVEDEILNTNKVTPDMLLRLCHGTQKANNYRQELHNKE